MTRPLRTVVGALVGAALHAALAGECRLPRIPGRSERSCLAALVTGATVEELLWRGPPFVALARHAGPAAAIGATAPAFALWHREGSARDTAGLLAVGVALGTTALAAGMAAAVAAHVTYDLLVALEPERDP